MLNLLYKIVLRKDYEKVLFPSGNTASKVEGHTTLEEFKKQKEDRIKELENMKIKQNTTWIVSDIIDAFGAKDIEFTIKKKLKNMLMKIVHLIMF